MTRRLRRPGFTVLELMVVLAVVLILGAILVPALSGFWSNNRTKAGVDIVTARLADARGAAISQGRAYRVCVSPDGRRVRVCPDESESTEQLSTDPTAAAVWEENTLPATVTLTPMSVGTSAPSAGTDGWVTLVVFSPDGTCPEDAAFRVSEEDASVVPMTIRVRGLTGVWTVNPSTADERSAGGMP